MKILRFCLFFWAPLVREIHDSNKNDEVETFASRITCLGTRNADHDTLMDNDHQCPKTRVHQGAMQ